MVEAGRDPKGRKTKVRRWMRDRDSFRTIFYILAIEVVLFYLFFFFFVVGVNFFFFFVV